MAEFFGMLQMQFMLFLLMGVGFLTAKLNMVDAHIRGALTNLVINIILPCNIVYSFMVGFDKDLLRALALMVAVGVGIQVMCVVLNKFIYNWVPQQQRVVMQYATVCSNSSFMGNPVVEGLFGSGALVYASAFLITLRVTMWTAGLSYFTTTTRKETAKKLATHPCIIATVVGFVLFFTSFQPPVFITKAIYSVGSCTTALSMIIVGNILAQINPRTIFSKLSFVYSAIRLVVLPGIVLGVLYFLQPPWPVADVSVVLAAMPAGTTTAILAERYGADAEFGAKIIFVSTILSMLTIPLWAMVVQAVLPG